MYDQFTSISPSGNLYRFHISQIPQISILDVKDDFNFQLPATIQQDRHYIGIEYFIRMILYGDLKISINLPSCKLRTQIGKCFDCLNGLSSYLMFLVLSILIFTLALIELVLNTLVTRDI